MLKLNFNKNQYKNRTSYSVQVTISKRFMLSRTATAKITHGITKLSSSDSESIARSILGFANLITNPETIKALYDSSLNKNIANEIATKNVLNFVMNNDTIGGTSIIKTNFLALLEHHNKHIVFPGKELSTLLTKKNPKIVGSEEYQNTLLPVRVLVEAPIALNFVEKANNINQCLLTGDAIPIQGRTKNINRDLIVTFDNGSIKSFDIKTGNYKNSYLSGDIHQVDIYKDNLINYPRDLSQTDFQIKQTITMLEAYYSANRNLISEEDTKIFQEHLEILNNMKLKQKLLTYNSCINNSFLRINELKTYASNININNVHYIQAKELSEKELAFLNDVVKDIPVSFLDKPSYMQSFLNQKLQAYQKFVNLKTYAELHPLRKTYPFVKELLKNYIPINT